MVLTEQDGNQSSSIPSLGHVRYFPGATAVILAGTFLTQLILVSITFPIQDLLDNKPLFYIDGSFHWYQMRIALNLAQGGNLIGYDPFFGGGSPGGIVYNFSGKVPAGIAILIHPWLSDIVSYKLYSFLCAVFAPLCVPLAAHKLRYSSASICVSAVLGTLLWWTSVLRWYHTAGMVSFVAGSYVALLYLAAILRYLNGAGGVGFLIGLGVLGALGIFWHPLFAVSVVAGTLIGVYFVREEVSWQRLGALVSIVPTLSFGPNVYLLYIQNAYNGAQLLTAVPHQKLVDIKMVFYELLGLWKGNIHGSKVYAPLALAAVWACLCSRKTMERRLVTTFTVLGIFLIVFASVGASLSSVGIIQPNRFAPIGYLHLILAAAVGTTIILKQIVESDARWIKIGALVSLTSIGVNLAYATSELRNELRYDNVGHYGVRPPEVKGLGAYSEWLTHWLRHNTSTSARVLFETANGRVHDGGHMAGYYAYTTQREFIGGPYPFMHFAGFWDGWLFNRPIATLSHDHFGKYMDLYNVGWIVVHSDQSKQYLDRVPGVVPVEGFRELRIYEVKRPHSYFVTGSGKVIERGHNNLVLSGLSGERVTLKYHYIKGLVSQPAVKVSPMKLSDDPDPFIMILNPPQENLRIFIP